MGSDPDRSDPDRPYPFAADNHQELNAREMADAGAALIFRQAELTPERLADAPDGSGKLSKWGLTPIARRWSAADAAGSRSAIARGAEAVVVGLRWRAARTDRPGLAHFGYALDIE